MNELFVVLLLSASYQRYQVNSFAIAPPSWSNPELNPCAKISNGWQQLFYPPLNKCFKIFSLGYPCPDTMELAPFMNGLTGHGECKCPPGTAQLNVTSPCFRIFDRGPCDHGEYFNPLPDKKGVKRSLRLAECRKPKKCPTNEVYWPEKNSCYELLTQGPCGRGKLLSLDSNLIPKCQCSPLGQLAKFFHSATNTCHRHFTQGNCPDGKLFLPTRTCGCEVNSPHYVNATRQCHEIGSSTPCPNHGYEFTFLDDRKEATGCKCRKGYVIMNDGLCHRLYTKGSCKEGEMVAMKPNSSDYSCIQNPCQKNFLYFPSEEKCYRIGSQGPCRFKEVVVFDFNVKIGVDGVSFNGICGCVGVIENLDQSCATEDDPPLSHCPAPLVEFRDNCYELYSRGPCDVGQWIVPSKPLNNSKTVKCQCKPGFVPYDLESEAGTTGCHGPSVLIARFLNGNKTYKFGFQRRNHVERA